MVAAFDLFIGANILDYSGYPDCRPEFLAAFERLANLATFSFAIAFSAMFFGLVQFLTYVWQYSILEAGLTIWPGPITAAVVAAPTGRILDRVGYRIILPLGSAFFAAGSAWLMVFAEMDANLWGAWLPSAILTGIGVGLAMMFAFANPLLAVVR